MTTQIKLRSVTLTLSTKFGGEVSCRAGYFNEIEDGFGTLQLYTNDPNIFNTIAAGYASGIRAGRDPMHPKQTEYLMEVPAFITKDFDVARRN